MKNLLITLTVLIATLSAANAAQSVKLEKGDLAVSTISRAEIVSKTMFFPPCPINALCQPATQIKLVVTLNGCADRLGPVAYSTSYNDVSGKYELTVSAINISTAASTTMRCFAIPTQTITINVAPDLLYNDVDLRMLN